MAAPNHQQSQSPQFDVQRFFISMPSPTTPSPASSQNPPPPPNLMVAPSSTVPSSSYPPQNGPHPHFPFQYPQQFHPNLPPLSIVHPQRSLSYPTPPLQTQPPNPNVPPHHYNERSGAEIMALLRPPTNQAPPPQHQPEPSAANGGVVGVVPSAVPSRTPSGKMPKGRRISGEDVAYDVDVRLQGEVQPQLEVTPITRYTSDPQLCLGRQIAVNKSYICYGLKQGNIRILNINTALRSLFRTQSQRVTDMAFFAEDVHLLASAGIDGRIGVWKISEGPDEEEKLQITGKAVLAIKILGEGEIKNPRVCWHCYKQEILVVGVGKSILRIDTNKVGKTEVYSSEEPLYCDVDKLIDGIRLVGKHDGEVTDLSICQWMTTRLVSASADGTIKIWEDLKAKPLAVLRPHDGQPVCSATFLTAIDQPDHIILITAGPQNRELKIWVSASEEGWLLPGDADSLKCTQKLELRSSSEPRVEEAFFNQVVALSQVGLLLLANAKRNAIYAVHFDYGPNPAATCMDYISEFTVTMPILSLTGTSEILHGQGVAQVYCVQTQAIQQYTLDLCQCLPPVLESVGLEKSNSSLSHVVSGEELAALNFHGTTFSDVPISSNSTDAATFKDISSSNMDSNPVSLTPPTSDTVIGFISSSPLPLRSRFTEISVVSRTEPAAPPDRGLNQPTIVYSVDQQTEAACTNLSDVHSLDSDSRNSEKKGSQDGSSSTVNSPVVFKHPTHLVTPSEILMGVSSEITNVNKSKTDVDANVQDVVFSNDVGSAELEVKVVSETSSAQSEEFGLQGVPKNLVSENKEKFFCSQASDLGVERTRECRAFSGGSSIMEQTRQIDGVDNSELLTQISLGDEEEIEETRDASERVSESALPQLTTPSTKWKKQKGKNSQLSGPSSSPTTFDLKDSPDEACTSGHTIEAAFPQILAIQDMLNQLVTTQKEMQKQMPNVVAATVTKECKRLEAALGRSIEKIVKANIDACWAHFQEENAKNDKSLHDRLRQTTSLISNFINKDFTAMLEKALKKELASVGPAMGRTISPLIEKTVSAAISESFQRRVGDKAVNQLEKSVNSKLESTVARQIQAQFQTSGKQALQDALKGGLEASIIPAFEMSCKAMFEQVDSTFRKGMIEHTTAAQQHFDSTQSSLALALRDAINTVSSLTQTLSGELADSQHKLLALAAAGANSSSGNFMVSQLSNGPLVNIHEKIETQLDPTKELSRLISESQYEEAFTIALQRSDLSLVSWLCSQVDLCAILATVPLPLSQGVLLSLLQQLACDINKDTARKLSWMTDVAAAINPTDPMIAMHVRLIFQQVNDILFHQRNLPNITGSELSSIRVLMHVINSMMTSSK